MQSRRSIRLRSHDYRSAGAYFITIGTWRMLPILGEVSRVGFLPSDVGAIVAATWRAIPEHFPTVALDAWCLMPNHLHGILWLSPVNGDQRLSPRLGHVIQQFKSASARRTAGLAASRGIRIWHRNYYERIIRSAEGLQATRRYIDLNPQRWWQERRQ